MSFPHAFATIEGLPVSADDVSGTEFTCICGTRGTYADVSRHITDRSVPKFVHDNVATLRDAVPIDDYDGFGGNTVQNYLPNEPRKPAEPADDLFAAEFGKLREVGQLSTDAEPSSAPDLPPPPPNPPQSPLIAESFQAMLRQAFTAGLAAAQTGETFEIWYQREVLQ